MPDGAMKIVPGGAAARAAPDRVTEPDIRAFVEAFYTRVRDDAELGPIFEDRLAGAWPRHMDRMVDFWSSVLLASGRFRGDPLGVHRALPDLRSEHFDRWLELFEEVLSDVLPGPRGEDVLGRARRMRMVLDPGPDISPDVTQRLPGTSTERAAR